MKHTILSVLVAATISTSAMAADMKAENNWEKGAKDAWIDGKAEATLLFNGNLNSFDINTDVKNGKVILTGDVRTAVDKKLAEELVTNIEGVTGVDNQLTVMKNMRGHDSDMTVAQDPDQTDDSENLEEDVEETSNEASDKLLDAKIATVIKTRLLMDSDISGFDINVDVEQGNVVLTGTVGSEAERELAIEIANNASDVVNVEDNLEVVEADNHASGN